MQLLVALVAGIVFGMGLSVSRMLDPAVVLNFLDVAGTWDPRLALVMGGSLIVFIPGFWWVQRQRQKPVLANEFHLPLTQAIDKPLLLGAVIFGLGWGLTGLCPGPVLANLFGGQSALYVFLLSMLMGMRAVGRIR